MTLLPINLTGGTYKHKSLPLSAQVTRNFWPQAQQDSATKSPYVLESFPGLKSFATQTGGVDRGMTKHKGVMYKVTGTSLYSVDSDGVHSASLGTITGSDRCIFSGNGDDLVITAGGIPYTWDTGTSTFTVGTDPDFESPNANTTLNSQTIYDGTADRFAVSDVSAPLDINALNYATAESKADNLVRPYAFDETVYMLGDETVEPWWNSGIGSPPFDKIQNGTKQIGLGALHSVANTEDFMYFYGSDDQVYKLRGSSLQVVSQQPLSRTFSRYTNVSDAIGWTMKYQGQWMFVLTFPGEEKTWIYPEGGEWFEWSAGILGKRSVANSYVYAYRKHLVADYQNGNIYELDDDTYENNGEPIIRQRDSGVLHGGLFDQDGKTLTMNSFELIMGTGVGLLSGQGKNPKVMLSFSDDGGRTFSTELWGDVGKLGDFKIKVRWDTLGSFENRIIRITTSDPVYYCIYSAVADIEFGI